MTLPNPVEVPDPNIDDPVLPEPVPEQEPPPLTASTRSNTGRRPARQCATCNGVTSQ